MPSVAETRRETTEAMEAIIEELQDGPLSQSEILESRNGPEGDFSATALLNATFELLDQARIEYGPDRRLTLREDAA